jgi:transcriptional regulator with XRE-family HTH domain
VTLRQAIAATLQAELTRLGLTTYALAKKAKLPEQTVRNYVNATVEPSASRLLALDAALGRKPGWLLSQASSLATGT